MPNWKILSQMSLIKDFELLHYFADLGRQIISSWRAKIFYQKNEPFITDNAVRDRLNTLFRLGVISPIKKGKNSLWQATTPYIRQTNNIYELANEAYPLGSLCYSTALEVLKLTDQRSTKIHTNLPSTTITNLLEENEELRKNLIPPDTELNEWQLNNSPSNINIKNIWQEYEIKTHTTKNEWIFGTEIKEIEGVRVRITSLERTLIDGLKTPKYCGGLNEVFRSWVRALDELDIDQVVNYVEKYDITILYQRVGFVMETLGFNHPNFENWKEQKSPRGGSRVLNPYKEFKNTYDDEWNLSINHPISILSNKDAEYS